MSYPTCFGEYDYEYTCFRCDAGNRCLEHTRAKESNKMGYSKEESKDERKERLDSEWLKRLPCYTCHPKMQRLCKHYNTFKRPDYNNEQFKLGAITCDDYIDPPAVVAPNPFDGKPQVYVQQFGDSGGDMRG